jgi:hypothetical protein
MSHNDVDTNFEILRLAVNTIVSDISGVEGKVLTSDLSEALLSYTDSGKNYAVQKDASSKRLFVNVPWTDTDTVYSLPTASNSVLGGIKVGTSLSIGSNGVLDLNADGVSEPIIRDDAVTTDKIANGAVTGAKIANGTITSTQLASSVSTQLKESKTVFVHVGNYYKNSTKYWASDLFNYNTTTGRYDARETIVLPFNDSEVPIAWGGYHTDSDAAIITEPFATVTAAARYVIHNHGSGCAIAIIVHGHVSWYGSYDTTGNEITDLHQWEAVEKLAIIGGRSDDTSGSHHSTFSSNGFSSARIDVNHTSTTYIYAPGCWLRGARFLIEGICFTHKHATDPRKHLRGFRVGGEGRMFHAVTSVRMNALDQNSSLNDYFYPWEFGEGGGVYFSSGSNQPHEFWTQGNMTLFQANGAYILYSNNANSNQVYLHNVSSGASIRMFECSGKADIHYKHSSVQLKTGTNVPAANINTAGFYHAFNNLNLTRWGSAPLYLPGNLQTSITQLGGTSNGTATNINTANVGGNFNYSDVASGSARTNYLATTTPSYYGTSYPSNTLYGKFTTEANNSSLSKSTLVGDGSTQNFKSAPTTRTGTGGTSSASAPYSDQ